MDGSPSRDIDLSTPNTARIYDYLLGGKDNYAADRAVGEDLLALIPSAARAARANHRFLQRAVRDLARSGITQFIDIGAKLPAAGNVHETAAAVAPDARVVFADADPVALAHARALLARTSHTATVEAPVDRPQSVLEAGATAELLDLERPIALILDRVLHFIPGDGAARAAVDAVHARLAPGSHVVFTHITQEPRPEAEQHVADVFRPTTSHFHARSHASVEALFEGRTLLRPGIVYTPAWRPDPDEPEPWDEPGDSYTLAGVTVV